MTNHNVNSSPILAMEDSKANLLLEVEYLMQAMKNGDLKVEEGYNNLTELVGRHVKAVTV